MKRFIRPPGFTLIYSFHSGGANFLMGDGSVRFIAKSATVVVIGALISRNGGEDIPGDF